jgi:4-hydroxy-3-methylbut-2-enyl diphosphate reductase
MNIEILLASPRGYCAGVIRAIDILNKVLKEHKTPIYVNHEIIHNKFIINFYEKKWIIFWEDISKIPENSLIIFSAHWIWPEFIKNVKKRKLRYIDASCPLVTKVHIKAKKYLSDWYEVIYIWKKWHQEAESLKEEWSDKIHIVQNEEELQKFENNEKLALLTQTTLSTIETKNLIEKIKNKFPEIILPKSEDICYATTNRQNAVMEICKNNIDLLIIIGSKNSSNSNKLKNIWEKLNITSLLIDSYKEIDINVLEYIFTDKIEFKIWISSWASAPEHLVQEVLDFFKQIWNIKINTIKTVEEKMIFSSNFDIR